MKKIVILALFTLLLSSLFVSTSTQVVAKGNNGKGGPNGTFVRFDGLDSYWSQTGSGILHEWRTTDNRHFVFKPADKFDEADCDQGVLNSFLWTAHVNYDQSYPFDEANLEDFLVVGDQYWVCMYEWESSKSIQHPELVQTLIVSANDANGEDSMVLVDGDDYIFRVTGTAFAGDTIDFDAKYSITNRIANDEWSDDVSGYTSYGTSLLDLLVDNTEVDWGEYSNTHEYTLGYTGDGNAVNFTIYDIYYPNNTGSLTVEIYSM